MSAAEGPANVLFVVMDTVRKDRLSVYGHDAPTTPGLEQLAANAAVYDGAIAQAPWTLPSHATMFTGQYPGEHAASQEQPYLAGATTVAESLSAAGYATACYSSNAWITPYTHLTDGFDEQDNFFKVMPGDLLAGPLASAWKRLNDSDRLRGLADRLVDVGNRVHERFAGSGHEQSKTPRVIDRTMAFIDEADAPFFAFINLMDAHLPYYPPEDHRERFAPGVDPSTVCQNSKEYNAGAREIDAAEWTDIRGLYDAEIRHIDEQLQRLFDWLREAGYWADTTVIVTSDHGELFGEHGLYGHEFGVYDPLVNVPCLVDHPAVATGRHDRQFELLDLYHTVLDATGVTPADGAVAFDPARSLLREEHRDFDRGAATSTRVGDGDLAFVEYSRPVVELKQLENKARAAGIELPTESRFYSRMRAVRRADAKYIRNERIADEFYTLNTDPGETTNRIDDDTATAAELLAALGSFEDTVGRWESDVGERGVAPDEALAEMDDDAKDRLRDLGYID